MSSNQIDRRRFLMTAGAGATAMALRPKPAQAAQPARKPGGKPNLVFVFGDQWRAQATAYAGDPNAKTPHLDKMAAASVNMTNAISSFPVCSPYRASLLTGRHPLTHGVFMNDVHLRDDAVSIAEAYAKAGYDTGYIGKWHIDGRGRSSFIPKSGRQGFDFWKVLECTHNYNNSSFYADADKKLKWEGYDAIAQTREAQRYIREHATGKPFVLFLSWGPPHAPYQTAPRKYRDMFDANDIKLRGNVPEGSKAMAKKALAGYYAHIAALDDCIRDLTDTIKQAGIEDDTIFVFTSDHGDMLGSRGQMKKQRPYDESIRVPFLLKYPAALGKVGKQIDMPIGTPDIMPTLLGLSGIEIPATVEGRDFSGVIKGTAKAGNEGVLIACAQPFGQWKRNQGGREYRGVRTRRHTYVRSLEGPWLLYDNEKDPYQMDNLIGKPEHAAVQAQLEKLLKAKLAMYKDEFLTGPEYLKKWGYKVDKGGTVPYRN